MPAEGYESSLHEASSVPTESNELQELKKLVTKLSNEVNAQKEKQVIKTKLNFENSRDGVFFIKTAF